MVQALVDDAFWFVNLYIICVCIFTYFFYYLHVVLNLVIILLQENTVSEPKILSNEQLEIES